MYRGSVDSAPPQPAALNLLELSAGLEAESRFQELSGLAVDGFWRESEADSVGLAKEELARVLLTIGVKHNYGLAPGIQPTRAQVATFWRALQLKDLALAHACALGRDVAWQKFLACYREPLRQAAIGMTKSVSLGEELADSLHSEIFGLTELDGKRRSPLGSYSGRGSLIGFLRAAIAQRNVDHHRRTHRETQFAVENIPAESPAQPPAAELVMRLQEGLAAALKMLAAEERFLLSAWYLDHRTLLEIGQILRVHEATVSRKVRRVTAQLRKELLKKLQASGMDRRAAEEALGTDPRDLDINLRNLLQASQPGAFLKESPPAEPEQA